MGMLGWGMTAKWSEMIAMSVRKQKALIMKTNILQNNEVDERVRPTGQGMWNLACLV